MGGAPDGGRDSGSPEGTWEKVATSLSTSRGLFTSLPHAITASDGRVLFVGGASSTAKDALDLFANGSFTAGTSLGTPRQQPGVISLADGSVLVAGGSTGGQHGSAIASVERWNPATGLWTTLGALDKARNKPPLARMVDGRIFVVGGEVAMGSFVSAIELIDPSQNFAVSTAGALTLGRSGHVATPLADGRIFVAGGVDGSSTAPVATEIFTPGVTGTVGTLTAGPSMTNSHLGTNAARLPNGGFIIAGGCTGGQKCPTASATCDAYNPVSGQAGTFVACEGMKSASAAHAMILLPTGRVLVAGGFQGSTSLTRVEVYDPVTNQWTLVRSLNESRYDAGIALTSEEKVIIAGGRTGALTSPTYLASAEMFDPGPPTMCTICQLDGACQILAAGTPCDDGSPSTTGETCKGDGVCAP